MAIAPIGGVGAAASNSNPAQISSLGLDDFMKILLTQLTYQDPMKPMDNQQFIAQLAQFTTLQKMSESAESQAQSVQVQSATQSISLLGKTVEVQGENGASTFGQVTTLRFANGQPLLTVTGSNGAVLTDVALPRISLVRL